MTASPDNNSGCLGSLFPFLRRPARESEPETLPYRVRDDFLTPAELSFYRVLSSLVGTRLAIQSKVRLADVFFVARPNENVAYLNRIAQQHIDFLVCDPSTMKPLAGIELDDASHRQDRRQKRDRFLEQVFQSANLPLLRVPVQRGYVASEIADLLAPVLKERVDVPAPPPQPLNDDQSERHPICPKCGIPMVLRTVSQGEHKGEQFYGCQNYPRCREMKPVRSPNAG